MQSENQAAETKANGVEGSEALRCPSCHAKMIRGMRFCRLCGYRLGEGIEEYAETRRFSGMPSAPPVSAPPHTAVNAAPWTTAQQQQQYPVTPTAAPLSPSATTTSFQTIKPRACAKGGMSWAFWVAISVAIVAATGGAIFKPISRWGGNDQRAASNAARSFFGADNFEDADDGGTMITAVESQSPAERAGLIGGDTIKSFDGHPVEDEDALRKLLAATPVGKTVEVGYVRDGETKQAMLTTISQRAYRGVDFSDRPEGEGFLGIDPGDLERVSVPNTKIHGVQLGDVYRNRPGYLAGLRDGDIIIGFNEHLIRTEKELLFRIDEALPDSTVKAVVMRGGERLEILVKMGRDD
ncbi:MAG: PDZ domain-containing protein [Pyrinomonadaceae bacterium]|nr:PDZ domain-containing protein [Pyrinomonadaceae bacterium]